MVKKPIWIIGIDEVGRGPLAGPVHVCAVAMPISLYKKCRWKGLKDSKQMTAIARQRWYNTAKGMEQAGKIKVAVAFRSASAIDSRGIVVCIRSCIKSAVGKLGLDPKQCRVMLDGGLNAPAEYIHQQTVIRGDDKHQIISLASVVAKVTRDRVMSKMHKKHPLYSWDKNKGYGTRAHMRAIKKKGVTPLHRKTFLTRLFP